MRSNKLKATLKAAILAVTVLLLTAGVSSAQNVVNLTASQQATVLPDGNTVPMWGWTCGTGAAAATGATCTALTYNATTGLLNSQTGGTIWQPPLIVVPYVATGTSLTINLTNRLPVETSLVIIGQSGGGLGAPVREAGPRADGDHSPGIDHTGVQCTSLNPNTPVGCNANYGGPLPGQTATTWTTVVPGSFTPPTQGERARTFTSVEVAGVTTVGATPAVGIYSWTNLNPGTYLIRTGTYPSIQGPMGLYGVLVVTKAPVTGTPGLAYPVPAGQAGTGVTYDADVAALESEIDARQNKMVAALFQSAVAPATANAGFSETAKWNPQCGAGPNGLTSTGALPTCYPPAVDYTPTYFLINGLAFSKDNLAASALSVPAAASTGNVLVRYVNAGSHMHVPTVDGLNMLLVAEDGYVLPDIALAITNSKLLTANNPPPSASYAVGLRIQDEVFQAAGKVFDIIVSPPSASGSFISATYPTWDRSLALGTNSQRDGGMQAILDVNDAGAAKLTTAQASYVAVAVADKYAYAPGVTLKVSDPGKGVIANDINVYGVKISTLPTSGTVTLYPNGTFTYVPTGSGADSFGYCANGTTTICTTVTLNVSATANAANAPTANPDSYTSTASSLLRVAAPGVLVNDTDPNGYALKASTALTTTGLNSVTLAADGSFTAIPTAPCTAAAGCPASFTYQAVNSQGIPSNIATVSLTFVGGSGLAVTVQDAKTKVAITDYKWIIEQDLTLHIDPACQQNGAGGAKPATCPTGVPPTPATQFHTSYYPVVATGCTGPQSCGQGQTVYDAGTPCTTLPTATTAGVPAGCSPTAGQHVKAACDGYGICTIGATQLPASSPADAHLAATNPDGSPSSYYISILSGDSANAFNTANVKDPTVAGNCVPGTEPTGITVSSTCGHTMGGSPIPAPVGGVFAPVTVNLELEPLKTATVTAFVFEDDYPLNGEPDTGGGVDVLATLEVPLGDFQFEIWDTAGGIGDFTGQMTYDTFNVPLTNALNGTIDPVTGNDACPISNTGGVGLGVIIVCPQYESDGITLSPLTGQAVVRNLMQGKYSLIAHPGAAREAAGEEWLQTNSLDGGHFLDSFLRVGEPPYFQEFGPGGYHVFMGMANPAHINARLAAICGAAPTSTPPLGAPPFTLPCNNNVNGQITNLHQGRSPNENLYSAAVFPQGDTRNYSPLSYTNCYAAIGDSDGATIALTKCDPDGNFKFTNLPSGNYGIVLFDQWDDFIVDGSSRPVNLTGGQTVNVTFPTFTWQTHLWSRTYMDTQGLGSPVLDTAGNLDPLLSPGLIQVPTRVRQRNGKIVNTLISDISGTARFDETFPLFAFYTVESDTTRFRGTGVHSVNDAGGQVDGPPPVGNGNAGPYQGILNSKESFPLPPALRFPGSVYCATADCPGGFSAGSSSTPSTGRIDPGSVQVEGWQGGVSEFDMLDWGKIPYAPGENGGIRGHVVYTSTRPFDDPRMNFQNLWDPLVPNVTINLYQEGTAPDGTTSLTLVDTTQTTSWDAWAQGFRADGVTPNMSCTGQDPADPFFSYTMAGTRNYLTPGTPLPNNSQYKCYDGYHNLNQLQPAPYDGLYQFPSATCLTPGATFTLPGNTTSYHCATIPNPVLTQTCPTTVPGCKTGAAPAILPPAKYVTEVIVPPNWELNKEEDLNLLIGDQYIAPVVAQFGGLGNIFITPDQASIDAANPSYTGPYTAANPYKQPFSNCTVPGVASSCTFNPNTTNNGKQAGDYGRTSFGSFGPGGIIQQNAPCVGLLRVVPDYLSISPESGEVAPFAGVSKNLCDRKEVTLEDTMQANADFFIWTKVAKAVTFTGFISDDFSSEFDPASPAFGEKFAIPNVPVSIKDFDGVEVSRLYSDQWGTYNGLVYGSWEVNVPNITGYSPNMMITCMNDPGPIPGPNGTMITDPYYTPAYSTFCYENPFMPGDATYLDTPVVPVSAFAEGYNPPDCAYPDSTPAIKSVLGDVVGGGRGPWVSAAGHTITITAAGDAAGNQLVPNDAYSGPAANTAPYNQKFISRHYGFGAGAQVTIGGVAAACTGGDLSMTCTVPQGVPACPLLQTNPHTGIKVPAQCGELVITAANGKQSVDTVTVTIGGTALSAAGNVGPTYIAGENATNNAIQKAIDIAEPGDLILVGPGTYNELVLMWKPVRLQGVGDGAVIVNANTHPAGKQLEPWRRQVNCLFGLALNGGYSTGNNTGGPAAPGGPNTGGGANPYDPNYNGTAGSGFTCPTNMQGAVDPIQGEPVVGWTANLNGNLAELLQEPTLMGAYEGAGITVLAKGQENNNTLNCTPENATGCIPLNASTAAGGDCNRYSQFYPSNFLCNPSRVDGITFTNSSQGGGGVFAHGWTHNLEVANLHVFGNGGTLTGGITIGQMETVDPTLVGTVAQPLLFNHHTHVHNNSVDFNASYGDELNSNTPGSAGGVTFTPGSDYYTFDHNWVCGNLSTGDGGGFAHHGFIVNGTIEHNSFLFNQSINPTLTTHGGGVVVQGSAPDGAACENAGIDFDCPPALTDGAGRGLLINANLFQGNTAEEGSGGGLMLMHVNGNDVLNNPNDADQWYGVSVINNIFANNVAGWTGGAVALYDAVKVDFRNNTVVSNDSTATAGVLFDSLGAPNANHAPPGCDPTNNPNSPACGVGSVTTSNPQPAGLATEKHSANLLAAFTNASVHCPNGNDTQPPTHACTQYSVPALTSDIFWQNRAFNIVPSSTGIVQLNPALTQTATGGCPTGASYWDIGVYTDTAPGNHASGLTLNPTYSILDNPGDYAGGNNFLGNSATVASQYCNGSRVPAEIAPLLCSGPQGNANAPGCIQPGTVGVGTTVPGGVPDSLVPPLPAFTLTPAATVDEGSNWINMFYGPLSLSNPTISCGGTVACVPLGNYSPALSSPAIDAVPNHIDHPLTDFFGNPRPDTAGSNFDIGAIEVGAPLSDRDAVVSISAPSPALTSAPANTSTKNGTITVSNTGTGRLTLSAAPTITKTAGAAASTFAITGGTCTTNTVLAPGGTCTIKVRYTPANTAMATAHVTLTDSGALKSSQTSAPFNGN